MQVLRSPLQRLKGCDMWLLLLPFVLPVDRIHGLVLLQPLAIYHQFSIIISYHMNLNPSMHFSLTISYQNSRQQKLSNNVNTLSYLNIQCIPFQIDNCLAFFLLQHHLLYSFFFNILFYFLTIIIIIIFVINDFISLSSILIYLNF